MIVGIGTDIVEIERLKKIIERTPNFINRVFTKKEQEYCFKRKNYLQSFAARFAAKEAFVKALGKGIGVEYSWLDIEIVNDVFGKPTINLLKNQNNKIKIFLSMSHEVKYAIAFVIIDEI